MKKEKIILVGAGGHAKSCIDIIEEQNKFSIFGIIGIKNEVGKVISGYEVIGSDDDYDSYLNIKNVHIAIGLDYKNLRLKLFNHLKKIGFKFPNIYSPRAYISKKSSIGEGNILMHSSILNASSSLGNNCIINTNALIEHDCKIGDNCHISTGVIINGNVDIGQNTFLGSMSCIKNGVKIGENCFIGMGSTVIKDLPSNSKYFD